MTTLKAKIDGVWVPVGGAGPAGPPGPQGIQGLQGEPGQSFTTFEYMFDATTTAPPTSAEVRFNHATPSLVTQVWVHDISAVGKDNANSFSLIDTGSRLFVQDKDDSTRWSSFDVTGPGVDHGVYYAIPVTFRATGPASLVEQRVLFNVAQSGAAGPPGPAGPGVAAGGTAGQVLSKIDATDYNTQWVPPAAGGGGGLVTAIPVPIVEGGTAGTTARLARDNLLLFDNNEVLRWKNTVGAEQTILYLSAGNTLHLGTSVGVLYLEPTSVIYATIRLAFYTNTPLQSFTVGNAAIRNLLKINASDVLELGDAATPSIKAMTALEAPSLTLTTPLATTSGGVPAGGTTGQVLSKIDATNHNTQWVAAGGGGISATIVDAKGDLIAATAADTVARVAVGTNGQVLTANNALAAGLEWTTPGTGGAPTAGSYVTIANEGTLSAERRLVVTTPVTLTDGGAGTTVTLALADNGVTNAKLEDMATLRLKGRVTASTGDPEDLTGTQATTILDVFTSALKGLVPLSGGGTVNYLRSDGTWTAPAATVADDSVTDLKLRNSVALSIIGRSANSTGDPADIAAGTDGYVLRRSGTTLGFGQVSLTAGVTGVLPTANAGVPVGGTANQVLAKIDATAHNMQWVTPGAASNGLPTGGAAGTLLMKTSATDYVTGWSPATAATLAAGLTVTGAIACTTTFTMENAQKFRIKNATSTAEDILEMNSSNQLVFGKSNRAMFFSGTAFNFQSSPVVLYTNNVALQGRTAGAVIRNLVKLNASDVLELGDAASAGITALKAITAPSLTLTTPLGVASGGTGGATAADARTALDVFSKAEIQGGVALAGPGDMGLLLANNMYLNMKDTGGTTRWGIGLGNTNVLFIGDTVPGSPATGVYGLSLTLGSAGVITLEVGTWAEVTGGTIDTSATVIPYRRGYGAKDRTGADRWIGSVWGDGATADLLYLGDGSMPTAVVGTTVDIHGTVAKVYGRLDSPYAVRAWAVVDGTTPALYAQTGIASLTRTATGRYSLILANPNPTVSATVAQCFGNASDTRNAYIIQSGTSEIIVETRAGLGGAPTDGLWFTVMVTGV